jgi:hypothetical protein
MVAAANESSVIQSCLVDRHQWTCGVGILRPCPAGKDDHDPIFWDDLFPVPPSVVEEQIAELGQIPGLQAQPTK